jgi:large subunit ribosomal protein L9
MSVMEVILLERVEALGQMGDVVKVKPGYARNYLLPTKKALRATKQNRAYFETQRAQLEAQNLKRRQDGEAVAAKMIDVSVIILRQAGEAGQLYGSVSTRDIADAVTAAGFTIDRRQVLLDTPIKSRGLYKTRVALHPEVIVTVTVNVAQSQEAAEAQAAGKTPEQVTAEAEAAEAAAAAAAAAAEAPAPAPAPTATAEPASAAEPAAKKTRKKKSEE